jgi:bifunctional UDP-N-acetylglucosamine pyrophosphorylase/glucosamine-1-phosphate N-acetyltransferase
MVPQLTALIMAAGHGTRMRSSLPKVLHPVCGTPMIEWVIDAARLAGVERVCCITRPGEGVAEALPDGAEAIQQTAGEGTGAAILAARATLEESEHVVVLSGDHPLVAPSTIEGLLLTHMREAAAATILTTEELDPTGYGRIQRAADGSVEGVVETKSTLGLAPSLLKIREISMGAYACRGPEFLAALDRVPVEPNGERYLTKVFAELRHRGCKVSTHMTDDVLSASGVNDRGDLMEVAAHAQRRILKEHATRGVTFTAPDTVQIDRRVRIGQDTTIAAAVTLKGETTVGAGCEIGPATTIADSQIGDGVAIPHSFLVECRVADDATIGPFAYLRPEADIRQRAKVGTFVEVKKSTIHEGAKVPHLSYIGDADIGEGANLGAGTITANYHRGRKTRTTVGEGVHTGVHTALVAPVNVGPSAYTGAGSVITEDVPGGALAVSRPKDSQKNIEGYSKRVNEEQS